MDQSRARDRVRRAQAAEVSGDVEKAVELLSEAAQLYFEQGQVPRAASLWRHCARLKPDRVDLAERAKPTPASGAEGAGLGQGAQRGPAKADPALECWCSFCCRPRAEAGPMASGPAGAFVCAECARTAARLLGAPAEVEHAVAQTASASDPEQDFIEAAVFLSKELGWSLAKMRTLSAAELRRALEALERLRRGRAG